MIQNSSSKTKYILALVLLAVAIIALAHYIISKPSVAPVVVPIVKAEEPKFYSQLDGTVVSSTAETIPTVLGVMIDNHPDARPPSGLAQARVVYEAFAEGGITRYLAIFNTADQVVKVGPVRSARPYYIDWFREYGDSPYFHCGGSPEALEEITKIGLFDVNQFFNDPYFWRATDREAPHNLYTNTTRWDALLKIRGAKHASSTWQGWLFNEAGTVSASSSPVSALKIVYSNDYVVRWNYQTSTRYTRTINNVAHKDDQGTVMTADTIIVQEMPTKVIDDYGRKEMETVGAGNARVLFNGQMIRGTWKKISPTDRTRFYDEAGTEIGLKPGQIWVQVVPSGTSVEVTS